MTAIAGPRHPDAVGYLNDLADEINEPWFKVICQLAVAGCTGPLDNQTIEKLTAAYVAQADPASIPIPAARPVVGVRAATADRLEVLTDFRGLKNLADSLSVNFDKRVTLIFGPNGSGKSSLCECLKALASSDPPRRPLQNVRKRGVTSPTFGYKFRSDAAQQTWTPAVGRGSRQSTVKYFDNAIAVGNVRDAVDIGRVVVLTPFRLNVFDRAKALTSTFREALQDAQRANQTKLSDTVALLHEDFAGYQGRPLGKIEDLESGMLANLIKLGEGFGDSDALSTSLAAISELDKASSDEGLRLLRAEHRELAEFLAALNVLCTAASECWALEPWKKSEALSDRVRAQQTLASTLIPVGHNLDELMALLRAVAPLCDLNESHGGDCPVCRRPLGEPEVQLFRLYHELLRGELETQIAALRTEVKSADAAVQTVRSFKLSAWDGYTTIAAELLTQAKVDASALIAADLTVAPGPEVRLALQSLEGAQEAGKAQLEAKRLALEAASHGQDDVRRQITELRASVEPLLYSQALADHLPLLREAQKSAEEAEFWRDHLPSMTPLLKKITDRAKEANEELVVKDFSTRLNSEYIALAEREMASFGVELHRKGADASVTLLPQVGGNDIESVLSEGEQRLHALALFFAELDSCCQSVLVFDDPVSSFDYNNIANYCCRLRDVAAQYPERQIIALTHNWEFFVQLQMTLNQAGLDGQLSVQVLENCTVVGEYTEKIADLSRDIEAALAMAGEPSTEQKHNLAAKLRRLIESVVNTHVFAGQRHQYKQKSQAVSAFREFTKVVRLLPAEATLLADLYSKLSVSEHDDPRGSYVNTDKAVFRTRYDQIKGIEAALMSRK